MKNTGLTLYTYTHEQSTNDKEILLVAVINDNTKELTPITIAPTEIDLNDPKDNYYVLIKRIMFDKQCDYLMRYTDFLQGKWVMASGKFAYTSDSRYEELCNTRQPMPIFEQGE